MNEIKTEPNEETYETANRQRDSFQSNKKMFLTFAIASIVCILVAVVSYNIRLSICSDFYTQNCPNPELANILSGVVLFSGFGIMVGIVASIITFVIMMVSKSNYKNGLSIEAELANKTTNIQTEAPKVVASHKKETSIKIMLGIDCVFLAIIIVIVRNVIGNNLKDKDLWPILFIVSYTVIVGIIIFYTKYLQHRKKIELGLKQAKISTKQLLRILIVIPFAIMLLLIFTLMLLLIFY